MMVLILNNLFFTNSNKVIIMDNVSQDGTATIAKSAGAEVFARILPSKESLIQAFSSEIPQDNIAVFRPFQTEPIGSMERSLCRRWGISAVICRESGGVTQRSWQNICVDEKIDLWLISRPSNSSKVKVAFSVNQLIDIIS